MHRGGAGALFSATYECEDRKPISTMSGPLEFVAQPALTSSPRLELLDLLAARFRSSRPPGGDLILEPEAVDSDPAPGASRARLSRTRTRRSAVGPPPGTLAQLG